MLSHTLTERWTAFRRLSHLARPAGRAYGICMTAGHDAAALALYLREEGASALLIPDMPIDEAVERAIEADCGILLHGVPERALVLPVAESPTMPRLLQLTSGTTGPPRVIGRSWASIDAECDAYNRALGGIAGLEALTPVILAPVSHAYGLICGVMAAERRGISARIADSRNPKRMLAALREHPDHLVYGVPVLLHLLETLAAGRLPFHTLMNSGAPLPPPLFERLRASSQRVMQQYGCSELGCIALSAQARDACDVGRPLDTHELSAGLGAAEPQEIRVRSGERRIDTGDLGYLGADGGLRLLGRMDDLINVSGRKVLPSAVEQVLLELPGVAEAVVYRGRHPVMGERVQALVVPSRPLQEREVLAWCRERLPEYQTPSRIRLVDRIPRLPSGKISRRRLTEEEGQG